MKEIVLFQRDIDCYSQINKTELTIRKTMAKHKVGSGESTSSIASKNGFFWKTIWEHPENAQLREKRKDPNVLFENDEIFIPEKRVKEVSKGTEAEHSFKIKGEPCKLKLQLKKLGKPRANEDYVLDIDGKLTNGKTDGDGKIQETIPPTARNGRLILKGGKEVINLGLDALDPVDTLSGARQRLNNLGFKCGSGNSEVDEAMEEALKKFQTQNEIDATGEIDGATKDKLRELCK